MIAIFIICIMAIVCYLVSEKLKEPYVGKIVFWSETTTVDENTAKVICKTGRVISVEKNACIQLESKDLVFIDKGRLFLEKWKLKQSIGMDLTRSELWDKIESRCHW